VDLYNAIRNFAIDPTECDEIYNKVFELVESLGEKNAIEGCDNYIKHCVDAINNSVNYIPSTIDMLEKEIRYWNIVKIGIKKHKSEERRQKINNINKIINIA